MTLSATTRQAGPFIGNGVTVDFPFYFKVWADDDIEVNIVNSLGVYNLLIPGSDYTVTRNPDQDATPGGTVHLPSSVPIGSTLRIIGALVIEQATDLPDGGRFRAEQVENALDYLTALIQEQDLGGSGQWQYPLPEPRANWLIGWNGTASALENKDPSLIIGGGEFWDTELQTAVDGQTLFTMAVVNYTPNANNLAVYVNGIRMITALDFTELSATEIVFAEALVAGDQVYFVGGQDVGAGGGGGVNPVGGVNIANFTMAPTLPVSRRWEYPSTNPAGWNVSGGTMTFDARFTTHGYWAANPNAHFGIGLRCDIATMGVTPRFHGVLFGNVIGVQEGAPHSPAAQIESRATGLDPGGALRFLLPNTWTPVTKLMEDEVDYKIVITSKHVLNDQRYISYKLWRYNTVHSAWDLVVDTGDMLDPNLWLDMTKTGLVFWSVFESNLVPWTIDWVGVNVTWAGIDTISPEVSQKVNRFDAEVESDLKFIGNRRRVKLNTDSSGIAWDNWTQFVSAVLNSNTTLLAVPNGTSVAANFMASNKSNMLLSYGCTTLGMNGAIAELTTYGVGVAHPALDFKIGGVSVGTFYPTGLLLAGNLTFNGLSSRIKIWNDSTGVLFDQWTRVVTTKVNGNTTLMLAPNGTSTASNVMATNKSDLTGAFGSVALGMIGARASVLTYTVGGGAHPELDFTIGATTVLTMKTTGLWLPGATEALGAASTRVIVTSPGGANALGLSQANLNLETYSTAGYIAGLLTDAGWTAGMKANAETAIRPLIALISSMIADRQAKRD